MSMFRQTLAWGCLMVAACALGQRGPRPVAIQWSTVKSGVESRADRTETFVMQNQADLDSYWKHTFGSLQGEPRDIAWSKELVAAVNLGPREKTGYSVWIKSVDKASIAEMRITWAERFPPDYADTKAAKQSPFQIIRIGRVAAQRITFAQAQSIPAPLSVLAYAGVSLKPTGNYYDVPCEAYATGGLCLVSAPTMGVISDFDSFQTYWNVSFGSGIALPTNVNFDSEQLVIVHLGSRPTTGYSAVIQGLKWTDKGTITVEWYEKTPAPGTVQAQHVTSPYTMVKIPAGNVKVLFKKLDPPKPNNQQSGGQSGSG